MTKKEFISSGEQNVAEIRLIGEPYHRTIGSETIDATDVLERLSISEDYRSHLKKAIFDNEQNLTPLFEGGYYGVDKKLKKGEELTYEEAFSLMTFVLMASNRLIKSELKDRIKMGDMSAETILLQGVSLLSALSAKEAYQGLTPTEIAGLVAATLELDTIVRINGGDQAFGIGGMGGDRGYPLNGENSKLYSLSTMGSAVLACFGNVHKHHSYPNTSKIAGQTAIEAIGARSDQDSAQELEDLQRTSGLLMTSCHTTRTLHTISHRLKGETINHVVGPLSIPADRETVLNAMIGVNDNVHPETIIKALEILQKKGVQNYGNSVAFCGLNGKGYRPDHFNEKEYYKHPECKQMVAIDEVAPPPFSSLVSFLVNGENMGTYVIKPSDFLDEEFLNQIDFHSLLIPNTADSILRANRAAITGEDIAKTIYLAMTAALGLFTRDYSNLPNALNKKSHSINRKMLHEAFIMAFEAIASGQAVQKLEEYVALSNMVIDTK